MSNTVVAAGAVLWREQAGDLQVALVHRARYDDWSFAKGKLDPGESIQRAAVREVREETGLRVKLGVRLASAEYSLPDGGKKVVHYWAAKVSRKALRLSDFKPDAEVEAIEWMSASVAAGRLDYDFDRELLATVVELHANSALDTRPVVVLRHAKALSRADWKARGGSSRDDAKRPLTDTGRNQAQALVPTLAAYALKRIYSSPWFRCRSTVAPLAAKRHLKIIDRDSFSEAGNAHNPRKTERDVRRVLKSGKGSLICAHRPSLGSIFAALAKYDSTQNARIVGAVDGPAKLAELALKPAQFAVLQLTRGRVRRLVSVEINEIS